MPSSTFMFQKLVIRFLIPNILEALLTPLSSAESSNTRKFLHLVYEKARMSLEI